MHPLAGIVLAYLLGSIPFAYLAGRVRGVDLRKQGSGNLGATNVLRVLGWKTAVPVLLLDALKGFVPAFFFPQWSSFGNVEVLAITYGVASIVGHVRPVFLLWKGGGKGVATAAGVFAGIAPLAMLLVMVVWVGVLVSSGYVSLASLSAAVAMVVVLGIMKGVASPVFLVGLVLAVFVFWTHRSNIGRLRRGQEYRFGRSKAPGADKPRTQVQDL